jgi:Protein kinase domain
VSPQAPDHRGRTIAGRYRLGAVIGEGGFGRVYRATDSRLGVQVAVKVISPWWAQDREWVERFAEEARTAAQIGHPGVVRVTDTGIDPEVGPYTVSELVEGESLRERLDRDRCLDADEAGHPTTKEALDEPHTIKEKAPADRLALVSGRLAAALIAGQRRCEVAFDVQVGTRRTGYPVPRPGPQRPGASPESHRLHAAD